MSGNKLSPVGFSKLLDLSDVNVSTQGLSLQTVTLQSEKFVTVREEKSLSVVEVGSRDLMTLNVGCDQAVMNPGAKAIAVREGDKLRIFHLEMKSRMASAELKDRVLLMRWLDRKTVALVTGESVYQWKIDGQNDPEEIFQREELSGVRSQITNVQRSVDGKWLLLGGIGKDANNQLQGVLQVFRYEGRKRQPTMDAYASCFASVKLDNRDYESTLICLCRKEEGEMRLKILEVGVPRDEAFNGGGDIEGMEEGDFPLFMVADNKYGMLFMVTKDGVLCLFDIHSGKQIFGHKASKALILGGAASESKEGGVVTVDQSGRVAHFYVNGDSIVNYVTSVKKDLKLGAQLARRHGFGGAEELFTQQFRHLMQSGNYDAAMKLAAESPKGVLRTTQTMEAFRQVDGGKGLSRYFQVLLKGKLNALESVELSRAVLQKPGGVDHVKKWFTEEKLTGSVDLGTLLQEHDTPYALRIFLKAEAPEKVVWCILLLASKESDEDKVNGLFDRLFTYSAQQNFTPDWKSLIGRAVKQNGDRARTFALKVLAQQDEQKSGDRISVTDILDIFIQNGDVKNFSNVALNYLQPRGDLKEDAELQTRVLEVNLMHDPNMAKAILDSDAYTMSHYDKLKIAALCERVQLYQYALKNYSDLNDIKRVLMNSHQINQQFLVNFLGNLDPEDSLECLRSLLKFNLGQNLRLAVEVGKTWQQVLKPATMIDLFEEFKSTQALYFYLSALVPTTTDPDLVFKFIDAATKLGQSKDVEKICRDNDVYDAKEVKEYLLNAKLKDPRSLIYVCDRAGFVDELTQHLYDKDLFNFIEAYVQRMNPKATPKVLGALLELNAKEEQIQKLMSGVRTPSDVEDFVGQLADEAEKRARLKILRPWLETRIQEGSKDVHVYNTMAKIYVDINYNARSFLEKNDQYDPQVVGKFCERSDPYLAFIAYKRADGKCDDDLIRVTNENGFFKDQARYLVTRKDPELWAKVLDEEKNEHRRQLIDQVCATALPESQDQMEVRVTVRAFMKAGLPGELIELLERIVLHGPPDGDFQSNKNLQSLLILTAMKVDDERVMDYVKKLDNFDGPQIAKIACSDDYKLYEEAFFVYKKFSLGADAVRVLLDYIQDIERAADFAESLDTPEVWSLLAKAQLKAKDVASAVKSYMAADDASDYEAVIATAKDTDALEPLIDYLQMARKKLKDSVLNQELAYAYARTDKLADLEDFIGSNTVQKVVEVGDKCFAEELFKAARIIYNHCNKHDKLAITLVRLELFQEAVDAARKASNINTWKEVCFACVDAEKFRLAQACGLHIIVRMDHLNDCIGYYETRGHFDQVIALLRQGLNLDHVHQGIYTQLAILYAKYDEEKLMEHVTQNWRNLNIPTVVTACRQNWHWKAAVFLYTNYQLHEDAIDVMIEYSGDCWEHKQFVDILGKCANTETYYRAIDFYLRENPLLLNDLLCANATKYNATRVVEKASGRNNDLTALALIKKYLLQAQVENVAPVNEAINGLLVAEEDHKGLQDSIQSYGEFDQLALARKLQGHERLQFRRIAAALFKQNKKFNKSIELSKSDNLWGDAMVAVAESEDRVAAEELLRFFVQKKEFESFAAALYICYELVSPDVVMELAWRYNLKDYTMPFMIQFLRHYNERMAFIQSKFRTQDEEKKDKEQADQDKEEQQIATQQFLGLGGPAPLMLMGPGMGAGIAPMGMGAPGMGAPGMGMPPMGGPGSFGGL